MASPTPLNASIGICPYLLSRGAAVTGRRPRGSRDFPSFSWLSPEAGVVATAAPQPYPA